MRTHMTATRAGATGTMPTRKALSLCRAKKVLRIPYHNKADGFMAALLLTLNQIKYCELHRCQPHVLWGAFPKCKYSGVRFPGRTPYFDARRGNNAFTYYFKPVCDAGAASKGSRYLRGRSTGAPAPRRAPGRQILPRRAPGRISPRGESSRGAGPRWAPSPQSSTRQWRRASTTPAAAAAACCASASALAGWSAKHGMATIAQRQRNACQNRSQSQCNQRLISGSISTHQLRSSLHLHDRAQPAVRDAGGAERQQL